MYVLSFKQPRWIGMAILLSLALVLSACGPANAPAASESAPTQAGTQQSIRSSTTLPPTEATTSPQTEYTNENYGYSLRFPEGYEARQTYAHVTTIWASQGAPNEGGRLEVAVERNLDQNAEWYANQVRQDIDTLGPAISSLVPMSTSVIDGQKAYIFGHVPGQDLSRQVFIVYGGFLYHLTFWPDDPQMDEAYQQMQTLYDAVMSSLRFLPERKEVPPVLTVVNMVYQIEQACETRSEDDITRLFGDDFFVAEWAPNTPEGVTFARHERNEASQLILDMYLSQTPGLSLKLQVDWESMFGEPFPFYTYFPDEVITPVLARGWGPQGADEAVMIIGHRRDGSLYWRGVFVTQGTFAP